MQQLLKSKKKLKAIVIHMCLILILGIYLASVESVSALTFSGRYNTGTLDANVAGAYSTKEVNRILGHVKKWNATSSKINISASSKSYSDSKLRIRYKLDKPSKSGTLGITKLYDKNKKKLDGTTGMWYYATCIVYNNSKNTSTGYDATLVHEVGHSLSLAHCFITKEHPQSLKHIIHQGVKSYTTISDYEKGQMQAKWGK